MTATIGRYLLGERLGEGGMGVVWAAHDPELDRKVAVKVLRERGAKAARHAERLRREAQALARLSHPHVVTVYDVGVDRGELYVVMQLVEGETLERHLARRTPAWRAVIELFAQAGRGLAEAHAAGIVHRDFKPGNALVDARGVVRVTDFGLARASEGGDDSDGDVGPGGVPRRSSGGGQAPALHASLTDGDLVGTPAYMAPEQLRAGPITAATDQFSFCVALWDALYGSRPFDGDSFDALRDAILAGAPREPPAASRVPRRVRVALQRGLSVDPARRFPSMDALLDAIAPRNRTTLIASGVALTALAGVAITWGVTRTPPPDPCATAAAPIDSVWGPAQRAALHDALLRAGGAETTPTIDAVAQATVDQVIARLDERAARWRTMRGETCMAQHDAPGDDPAGLELRMGCLDRSLISQRAAVDRLSHDVDRELLARAVTVAEAGLHADECVRPPDNGSAPRDPALDALYARVAALVARVEAGEYAELLADAEPLAAEIERAGDASIAATYWHAVGTARQSVGTAADARSALRAAAQAASAAGDDLHATECWAIATAIATTGDLGATDDLLAVARAAAERSADPRAMVYVEGSQGGALLKRGSYDASLAACERALAIAESTGGEDKLVAYALACVANAQVAKQRFPEALATTERVLAIWTRQGGPDHPQALDTLYHIGTFSAQLGDIERARASWQHAIERFEWHYGPDNTAVMRVLTDVAIGESRARREGWVERATAAIDRAIAIGERLLGPGDPQLGRLYMVMADAAPPEDHARVRRANEKAIAVLERLDDPVGLSRVLYNQGDDYAYAGEPEAAIPFYRRAAEVARGGGQSAVLASMSDARIGACLIALGRGQEAEPMLKRSIAELDALGQIGFAGQARWELATLYAGDGRMDAALELARAASRQLAGRSPREELFREAIDQWIRDSTEPPTER